MRWTKIIVMCTIYVWIGSPGAIDAAPSLGDHVANLTSINDLCFTWECISTASWITRNMNPSVDPCDDFYEFACGRFGKKPADGAGSAKEVFNTANDEFNTRLKYIIEDIDTKISAKPFKLVKILYENCMNRNEDIMSAEEMSSYFDKLTDDFGWPVLVGQRWRGLVMRQKVILSSLFEVNLEPDLEDNSNLIPWIKQRRRVLDPEILRMGFTNDIVYGYYKYMVDIAVLFGADKRQAENELRAVVLAEIGLANDTVSEADRWITHRANTRTTVGEFVDKYPIWHRRFLYSHVPQAYKLTDKDVIMVPKDFDNVVKVLSQTPKRVWANLIWWLAVESSMASIAEEIRDRIDDFNSLIGRSVQPVDKWRSCVEVVRSNLGLSLSALYQRRYIDQKVVKDTNEMVTFIQQAIYEIVEEADWLDIPSKREALQKFENIVGHVAFRNEYKDDKKLEEFYKDLELVEGDIRQNIANISVFWSHKAHSHLRYSLERDHWTMNGNLVSPFGIYHPSFNTYSVPAVYVLPDYYELHRAKFLNYATLGFPIAHEMSHSLDTNGIFFDKNANLREWWSAETKQKFDERVKCIIDQYGNYTVDEDGLKLRAYHNLDECIADNLGVKAAYGAYLKWASQHKEERRLFGLAYTPKQMFWTSLANTWCTEYKNLGLMNAVLADEHSPAKFRINGAFANRPEFSNDFECKPGSNMNPVKKCSVW